MRFLHSGWRFGSRFVRKRGINEVPELWCEDGYEKGVGMKINRYECDCCHAPIENGREYKVTIKYPIPDSVKVPSRIDREKRKTKTVDMCLNCFSTEYLTWVNQ